MCARLLRGVAVANKQYAFDLGAEDLVLENCQLLLF